ncbi:MAG: hypothetical protein QXQ18_02855 [Candidatus Aenigmatarchaeota archaeon]
MRLKSLMPLSISILLISIVVLIYNYFQTGDFFLKDIDLKGGTSITIETNNPINSKELELKINEKFGSAIIASLKTSTGYGAKIEVEKNVNSDEVISTVKSLGINVISFSVESIGSSLGEIFFQQLVYVLIVAFVLMSIVIFLIYRNPISSFGIVFAVLGNTLTTLAFTSLLGIKISFAGLAGLLMLIGYTVDTNIVLTNKVVRTTPEVFSSQYKKAFVTGVTLIATITLTMLAVFFLSTSKLLTNISSILIIGFLTDLPYTWIFNAAVLEWWIKRKYKV